ncbi:MAG: hypothetical protein MPW14_09510 [Candidatus Manganitrophus sp.]|nr:hypothetical protein [Candidatus Manganitrophus sp.]WDT70809.1 MAG: hypothetical protein MPW17_18990 [Candidatus Manganitrophus sp.]WDT81926.1 MAG: hypothetical protein MPW14_09510 [Candidatus Manganitrophus sp.]
MDDLRRLLDSIDNVVGDSREMFFRNRVDPPVADGGEMPQLRMGHQFFIKIGLLRVPVAHDHDLRIELNQPFDRQLLVSHQPDLRRLIPRADQRGDLIEGGLLAGHDAGRGVEEDPRFPRGGRRPRGDPIQTPIHFGDNLLRAPRFADHLSDRQDVPLDPLDGGKELQLDHRQPRFGQLLHDIHRGVGRHKNQIGLKRHHLFHVRPDFVRHTLRRLGHMGDPRIGRKVGHRRDPLRIDQGEENFIGAERQRDDPLRLLRRDALFRRHSK